MVTRHSITVNVCPTARSRPSIADLTRVVRDLRDRVCREGLDPDAVFVDGGPVSGLVLYVSWEDKS